MSETTQSPPAPAPDAPARRPYLAPLISTVLTAPLACVAYLIVGLSQMACDACMPAEAHRFGEHYTVGVWVFRCGLLLSLGMLLTSYLLPPTRRHAERRGFCAVMAPAAVLLFLLAFIGVIGTS